MISPNLSRSLTCFCGCCSVTGTLGRVASWTFCWGDFAHCPLRSISAHAHLFTRAFSFSPVSLSLSHLSLSSCLFRSLSPLVSENTQLTFTVLFPKFWDLRTSSSQPKLRLRFLSPGCVSTNDVCKLRIHVLKTTSGQEQNYESIRPNYEKVLDRIRSHVSKLRIPHITTLKL